MIDAYIRLLERAAGEDNPTVADAVVAKLVAHLERMGRMKMLPQILRKLRNRAEQRHTLEPRVEVAHREESAQALRAAAALGIEAQKAQVNASLIRGWRAQAGGKLIDHSAKHALVRIYQKVIA